MSEIKKTLIATSDPLSICNGFALFPKLGTFRAGYIGTDMVGTIFAVDNKNILLFRLSANAKYEVIFGLCGPAYATEMEVEGSTDNGKIELTVEGDEIQAGILFGLTLSFAFNFTLDTFRSKWVWDGWHSHLSHSWSKLLNVHFNFEIDVIEFIYECIKVALEDEKEKTVFKKVPHISNQLIASWGMYDERKNNFVSNGGEMIVTPTLNIPIDIAPMLEPVIALNLALKAFLSNLSFGPLIGIQMPVTVKMNSVTLDDTQYSPLAFADGKVTGNTTDSTTETKPKDPSTIKVELNHSAGFDLGLGLFLNLNLVKLFNVGFSHTWPVLSRLGIEPNFGPYSNNLLNKIGQSTVDTCSECGGENVAVFDVIFEPPEGLV
ncbi:MAG: hypothetical protein KKC20_09425 [Proteobacteria bacterium]|nr:hypothetical protein [Pseudomonadota bacterium]